jgi:hypothetical protein
MRKPLISTEQIETVIRGMPEGFTTLDFVGVFKKQFPVLWRQLAKRYGLHGSGTRYSVLTYLSNRLSVYSRRKSPGLLEPTPTGWNPQAGRFLRRTTSTERKRFGSPWIVVFRRRKHTN